LTDNTSENMQKNLKHTKSRLIIRILYLTLLFAVQVLIIISFSKSWFAENPAPEVQEMDLYVRHDYFPVFMTARINYNHAYDYPPYTNDLMSIKKTVIPGDLIDLSVFVKIEKNDTRFLELVVTGIEPWIYYVENSAKLYYADIINGSIYVIGTIDLGIPPQPIPDTAAVIEEPRTDFINITQITRTETDSMVFKIELFDEFFTTYLGDENNGKLRHDGFCIDFQIYFYDDGDNQNILMKAKKATLGFYARLPEESASSEIPT